MMILKSDIDSLKNPLLLPWKTLHSVSKFPVVCFSKLNILMNLNLFLKVLVLKFKKRRGGDWETAYVVCIFFPVKEGL